MDLFSITLIFQIAVLSVQLFCGIFFMKKFLTVKDKKNYLHLVYSLFFLLLFVGQGIYFYYLSFLTRFDEDRFDDFMPEFIAGTALHLAALSCILLITEHRFFKGKDKYILFIAVVILVIIIGTVETRKQAENLVLWGSLISMFLPLVLWSYIFTKTVGIVRRKSFLMLLGIFIYLLGMLFSVSGINSALQLILDLEIMWIYNIGYTIRIIALIILFKGFSTE